jgi:hypothetical protein
MPNHCRAALDVSDYNSGWQQLGGPVDASVAWLKVRLAHGKRVTFAPRPALADTHRWLRHFHWASVFLPKEARAVRVTAIDTRGYIVSRLVNDHGVFLCKKLEP